jgi:cell division protein FtsW (lipid II flippase)
MNAPERNWWIQWAINIWDRRWLFLFGPVLVFSLSIGLSALLANLSRIYSAMVRVLGPHLAQITIGVVVILVGIFAHWFKRRNQRWYGIVEVIFGIISAFSVAFAMSSDSRYCPSGRH